MGLALGDERYSFWGGIERQTVSVQNDAASSNSAPQSADALIPTQREAAFFVAA